MQTATVVLGWLAWAGVVVMANASVLHEADASRRGLASLKQLAILPPRQQQLASLVLAFREKIAIVGKNSSALLKERKERKWLASPATEVTPSFEKNKL